MKSFEDCLAVIDVALPRPIIDKLIATVNGLLDDLYDTRDMRASQADWMDEQEYQIELETQGEEQEAVSSISRCVHKVIEGCKLAADPTAPEMVQVAAVLERLRRIDAMRLTAKRHR